MLHMTNLLRGLPPASPDEVFETLLQAPGVKQERIVSRGQASPEGEWYDQDWDEWAMLLAGGARLLVEEEDEEVTLEPGDALLLPARRHRVTWTDPAQPTLWLALHVGKAA